MLSEVGGRWHPGIGDPTVGGWITVAAYFSAALLAYSAQRLHSDDLANKAGSANAKSLALFWLLVAGTLVLLGINKQLDLQTWLTEVGRDLAQAQGWYAERRPIQALFVAALTIVGLAGMAILIVILRRLFRQVGDGLFGLGLLVTFIAVRAASFHHVDQLLKSGVVRLNWALELGGIGLIALSAWRQRWGRSRRRTQQQPGSLNQPPRDLPAMAPSAVTAEPTDQAASDFP